MSDTSSLSNPHDRFFRYLLGHPQRARTFIQHVLPANVVGHLALDTLQVEQTSFVDPDLRSHQGDLLFRVRLARSGKEAYLYVLFEHKSYPDPWVAWQLLRYMVRIWEAKWHREQRLVPIVPVVVYHGERRWRAAPVFSALLDAPDDMRVYMPDFQYLLYDLSVYEDVQLRADVLLRAGLLLMKYIQRPELREHLEQVATLMAEVLRSETGIEAAIALLRYLAEAGRHVSEEDVQRVVKALPGGGEIMATVAQKWKEEGLREGMIKGLVAVLRARFAPDETWLEDMTTRLQKIDNLERLEALHITAAQVQSLEAFEAALKHME